MKINYTQITYRAGQYSPRKLQQIYRALPPERKHRIAQVDNPIYREFLTVEFYLVAKKLNQPMQQDFAYTKQGKPYFINQKLNFSISHSQDRLVVVFAPNPIGVDVQHILPFDETVAKRICNAAELQMIHDSSDPALAFTRLWTQKESLVKLQGGSLYGDVKNILAFGQQYVMKTYTRRRYVVSVCVENERQS